MEVEDYIEKLMHSDISNEFGKSWVSDDWKTLLILKKSTGAIYKYNFKDGSWLNELMSYGAFLNIETIREKEEEKTNE